MPNDIMNFAEITQDTRIEIETSEQAIALSVNDVLKWIAPGAPPKEALKFLTVCRSAGLHPLLGEVYLVPMKDKWATIIAKGGYLKRAQKHRDEDGRLDWDGHESGVVVQEPARDPRTGKILPGQMVGAPVELDGEIVPLGWLLMGGWAKVYRKGITRPIKARVSFSEYAKESPPWKQYPGTMIVKVALTHAIKEAFAISDSYDDAESDYIPRNKTKEELAEARQVIAARVVGADTPERAAIGTAVGTGQPTMYTDVDDPSLPPAMMDKLAELRGKIGIDDARWSAMLARGNAKHAAELSIIQGQALIQHLEGVASRAPFLHGPAGGRQEPGPAGAVPVDTAAGRGDVAGGAGPDAGDGAAGGVTIKPGDGPAPETGYATPDDATDVAAGRYAPLPTHDIAIDG